MGKYYLGVIWFWGNIMKYCNYLDDDVCNIIWGYCVLKKGCWDWVGVILWFGGIIVVLFFFIMWIYLV